mmetsp:Transcript_43691/g.31852  ORF Transcript_43691/g.31852 Transcript_43691/m.31852 type:complete len:120 (-) Transcript_43691:456-815(-)
MEALMVLGNPNKEYFKEQCLMLNYLDLGIDIMIDRHHSVKKFILHCNNPESVYFCFHSRCNFELRGPLEQINRESKEEEINKAGEEIVNGLQSLDNETVIMNQRMHFISRIQQSRYHPG